MTSHGSLRTRFYSSGTIVAHRLYWRGMTTSSTGPGWGRGPLVVAGVVVACLLGALLGTVVAALGHRNEVTGLVVAAGLILLALLAMAVLVIVLVRDRFPREVLARLAALESVLERAGQGGERTSAAESAPAPPAVAPPAPQALAEPVQPPPVVVAREPVPAPAVPPLPAKVPAEPRAPARELPAAARERPRPAGGASLEMLLGGRGLAVAGVVVLVIAIGLFLKFGWDQGWFRPTPPVRVALGVVTGLALLAAGEWARRTERYRVLSQVLTAGGVGALYLSAWAAHGLYRLVGAGPAFLLLAASAGLGVAVATATRGRMLASLATVAGVMVPLVVALPDSAPTLVYLFLLVVVAAVLPVAAGRGWPELGVLALVGIALDTNLAFRWRWPTPDGRLVDAAFLLAAMALFFAITLAHAWRRRQPPRRVDLVVLAAASLGGWAAGLGRLQPLGEVTRGAWTLVVLLVELVAAHLLLVRLGKTAAGRQLFLALALVLMTALPPVLWDGAGVAAAWAVEALVLALAARVPAVGHAAAVISALAAVVAVDSTSGPAAGFVSTAAGLRLVAAVALAALLVSVERRAAGGAAVAWSAAVVAGPAAGLALLAWLVPPVVVWAGAVVRPVAEAGVAGAVVSAVLAVAGGVLLAAWPWRPLPATTLTGAAMVAAGLVWGAGAGTLDGWHAAAAAAPLAWTAAAMLAVTLRAVHLERGAERWIALGGAGATAASAVLWRLQAGWPGDDVVLGGLLPAALGGAAAALLLLAARRARAWPPPRGAAWLETAGWVTALAAASRLLASAVALEPAVSSPEAQRVALVSLSVLWGGAGLALVLAGLIGRTAYRRHLGLGVLGLTVAKVFLFDLASAPTVLRIVAFLVTGLALLAGAYLYARFRERLEAGA